MKSLFSHIVLFLAVIAFIVPNFTACKDPTPPVGIIQVVDIHETPVEDAWVKVFCTVDDCVVGDSGETDAEGEIRFEFPNPAILKVEAEKTVTVQYEDTTNEQVTDSVKTLYGEGFIELVKDETVTEQITLNGSTQ